MCVFYKRQKPRNETHRSHLVEESGRVLVTLCPFDVELFQLRTGPPEGVQSMCPVDLVLFESICVYGVIDSFIDSLIRCWLSFFFLRVRGRKICHQAMNREENEREETRRWRGGNMGSPV